MEFFDVLWINHREEYQIIVTETDEYGHVVAQRYGPSFKDIDEACDWKDKHEIKELD
jgi:hypothetical protein